MDPALEDIKRQLDVAKENLDAALSRAVHLQDNLLIENLRAAEDALLAIHRDEEDEERMKNSEFRELGELESIERRQESLLEALQRTLRH